MSLLELTDLHACFDTPEGKVRAVDGVTLRVAAGESVGIVGESGSGKTALGLSIPGLLPRPGRIESGSVRFRDEELLEKSERELRRLRGDRIAMVFQDAMTSLNPFLRVGEQVGEPLVVHGHATRRESLPRAVELLERVGIPDAAQRAVQFPHQFSGGMRQRALIAMAVACRPDLIIADEPTTALDVTLQAQILELLRERQEEDGAAILLITHDLAVVSETCHRVVVLYGGRIVEEGPTREVFAQPTHPYTRALLDSVPSLEAPPRSRLATIPGQTPDLKDAAASCRFAPRCEFAIERCGSEAPRLEPVREHGGKRACFVDVGTLRGGTR